MISKALLERAAEQHIIQAEQIDPLLRFIEAQDSAPDEDNREEPLKFIRSFGDVFITVGVVFLVVAINMMELSGYYYLLPAAAFVVIAEWLVRLRRLALPGIAILLAILFFVHKAFNVNTEHATTLTLGLISLASLLFYLRYKMPFSLLPLAAGLVALATIAVGMDLIKQPIILSGFGLVVFAVAMWFDTHDTARVSHFSDNAFWLHLLASPLIVHGTMVTLLLSDQGWVLTLGKETLMIVFFTAFLLIALLLDRRAMLISTQLYMIYALTQLLGEQLTSTQNILIYILIGLGLLVILFGSYWYKIRRLVFGALSGHPVSRYLPDFKLQDSAARR